MEDSSLVSEQIQKTKTNLFEILDKAQSMELKLSEDDSEYDLSFLSNRLAKVSVFQERLSDMLLDLTRINIFVKSSSRAAESALRAYVTELKLSDEYNETPRAIKTPWIEERTSERRAQTEEWMDLSFVVSEVKEAVSERQGTMKRLDSDLRLHARLFETKVASGAAPRPSFSGEETPGIDMD